MSENSNDLKKPQIVLYDENGVIAYLLCESYAHQFVEQWKCESTDLSFDPADDDGYDHMMAFIIKLRRNQLKCLFNENIIGYANPRHPIMQPFSDTGEPNVQPTPHAQSLLPNPR
jgi:hypothetical protein